jgi:hypothetical protein
MSVVCVCVVRQTYLRRVGQSSRRVLLSMVCPVSVVAKRVEALQKNKRNIFLKKEGLKLL